MSAKNFKKFNIQIDELELRTLIWCLIEAKASFINKNELQTKLVKGVAMPRNCFKFAEHNKIDDLIEMLSKFEIYPPSKEFNSYNELTKNNN